MSDIKTNATFRTGGFKFFIKPTVKTDCPLVGQRNNLRTITCPLQSHYKYSRRFLCCKRSCQNSINDQNPLMLTQTDYGNRLSFKTRADFDFNGIVED